MAKKSDAPMTRTSGTGPAEETKQAGTTTRPSGPPVFGRKQPKPEDNQALAFRSNKSVEIPSATESKPP